MTNTATATTTENQMVTSGLVDNPLPTAMETFAEKIKANYPEHFSFAERLIAAEERLPTIVDNDTDSGKLGDYIKQAKGAVKTLDSLRVSEKEPYLEKSRLVDGFFKNYMEKLKKITDKASAVQAEYLKKKEDEARREREEQARILKEKAEAELKEAQRIAEEARQARIAQEQEAQRLAEENARKQREIEEKAAEEKRKAQEEIEALKKAAEEQEKIDAETKKALKEANEKLKEIEKEEKSELKNLNSEMKTAEKNNKDLEKAIKTAEKESVKVFDSAVRTEKQAVKMDVLANASSADLARTRGFEGSLSTVRTDLRGVITSREDLDLETLRPYFRDADLQFAVDQFVKAYGESKTIKGVTVIEESKVTVR